MSDRATRSWFEPMQVMDHVPGRRVVGDAETLSITLGGVSKLVDSIEHAASCGRVPNPNDARSPVVDLTPAGRRVLGAARRAFDGELAIRLGAPLSPERLASFGSTVRDVRQHVARRHGSTR